MTAAAPHDSSTGAQIFNIALFAGALLMLGAGLARAWAEQPDGPELSEDENRVLAELPELRGATILDGSFTGGVDEWIADHFAARERFMALHFWLEAHRGARSDEEFALYAVDIDTDAELEPLADEGLDELVLDPFDDDELELEDDDLDAPDEPGSIVKSEGILIADGRAMQLFAGSPRGSRRYAKAINEYAEALRGEVTIYSVIVPTAQTFYLPESYTQRVRHEPPNIAATYAMLDPSVITVDVVAALVDHADEYIYFRTDHHWTGLGAYYAYTAFCASAGLEPSPLASLESGVISPYRGSLYRYTRDSKLGRLPDQVHYWLPPVEVSVTRGSGEAPGTLVRENSKGYGVFLGGDQPLLVARTSAPPGRRALLIKNSYGNPFAVFLAAHFETLVIVDYRKFDGSVSALIEEHQITDLIVLNGAITANAKFHVARIARLLDGGKRERRREAQRPGE